MGRIYMYCSDHVLTQDNQLQLGQVSGLLRVTQKRW